MPNPRRPDFQFVAPLPRERFWFTDGQSKVRLSSREYHVLQFLLQGITTNQEIAQKLAIQETSVSQYMMALFRKFGLSKPGSETGSAEKRILLIQKAVQFGIVPTDLNQVPDLQPRAFSDGKTTIKLLETDLTLLSLLAEGIVSPEQIAVELGMSQGKTERCIMDLYKKFGMKRRDNYGDERTEALIEKALQFQVLSPGSVRLKKEEGTYRYNGQSVQLSPRELELIFLVRDGLTSDKKIAEQLGTSVQTVKNQFTSIYTKFGIQDHPDLDRGNYIFMLRKAVLFGVIAPFE